MSDDARWLAENVILPRLDALDKKLEQRDYVIQEREQMIWESIEEQKRCSTKVKVTAERQNGRLHVLEEDKRKRDVIIQKLDEHVNNNDIHFNKEKSLETNIGYLAKKKVLLIFVTALGILVSAATGLMVAWMNGLIGG